jgi:hypothetical protein
MDRPNPMLTGLVRLQWTETGISLSRVSDLSHNETERACTLPAPQCPNKPRHEPGRLLGFILTLADLNEKPITHGNGELAHTHGKAGLQMKGWTTRPT